MAPKKRIVKKIIEFDEVRVLLPDDSILKASISEELLINKDVPADLLRNMAECGAKYSRWGVVRADLQSYLEFLEDEFDIFMKEIMSTARKTLGKVTESAVSEKAILNSQLEYLKKKKEMRKARKAIEKIKRIMRSLEINSEMTRSISARLRKEAEIGDPEDAVIKKKGNLKNF
ncbi:hypothetical protein LCGC14_0616710 [marine sediment metagenome]|uniref:Uncharacterized protein n=1 Tax=marine sediment metagenome TaxID=412755 RepID=A0A0F9RAU4_9ZZZZ